MKAKDLIDSLKIFDPEAEILIELTIINGEKIGFREIKTSGYSADYNKQLILQIEHNELQVVE